MGRLCKVYVAEPHLKPASEPTKAVPGSLEKIEELLIRYECGEELWHPDDLVVVCISNRKPVTSIPSDEELMTWWRFFVNEH